MASPARGHFVWHELLTTDTKGAITFYGQVAGWTTKAWEEDKSYVMFMCGKSPMAGVLALPPDAQRKGEPCRWLCYIATDDVDVAAWEAQRLGGKVIEDTESLPSIGKFAVLQDPFGAVFAIIQPTYDPKPKYPPPVGDFSWHELVTGDVAASFRFYSALFGWEKTRSEDMGPEVGPYQIFGTKGKEFGGIYRKTSHDRGPHRWLSYTRVGATKAAAEAARKAGGQIIMGPMETPDGGWIAAGVDPQGAEFAVHSVKTAKKKVKKPARKVVTKKRSKR
jgi:predicted enzyme related to lactoylglutathione lyase